MRFICFLLVCVGFLAVSALGAEAGKDPGKVYDAANDPHAKEGNVEPKIVPLTAEAEAKLLKDVKVADGFEVSLFANSAAANYPVFVAASVEGTLYVSSDGNGSLGRKWVCAQSWWRF